MYDSTVEPEVYSIRITFPSEETEREKGNKEHFALFQSACYTEEASEKNCRSQLEPKTICVIRKPKISV
jgi:hypothetical protein